MYECRADDDKFDESGAQFAKLEQYRNIPKIILTNYPSLNSSVELMLHDSPQEPSYAINYVSKLDGPSKMLDALHRANNSYLRINRSLLLTFAPDISTLRLAQKIDTGISRDDLMLRDQEIEDLLRTLFTLYDRVDVTRILTNSGGAVMLTAYAVMDCMDSDRAEAQFWLALAKTVATHLFGK